VKIRSFSEFPGTAEKTEFKTVEGFPVYRQKADLGEYFFVLLDGDKIGAMGSLELCERYKHNG